MTIKEQQEHVQRRKDARARYDKSIDKYEILNTARKGEIETENGPATTEELQRYVDIDTKSRAYTLHLEHGPYTAKYTPSGDTVLYIGENEVAAVNTVTMRAVCEREIDDKIWDGTFLHRETFWALAQSKCVYIYDQNGVEIHALREHKDVRKMTYMQDHFLLGTVSYKSMLRYHDTTMGKLISEIDTKERDSPIVHDRTNGVVYLSGSTGNVMLWSPRSTEYLAKMSAHRAKVKHVKVSECGTVLVTSSGNELRTWDIRNMFAPVTAKTYPHEVCALDISQRKTIAIGQKNRVEVHSSTEQSVSVRGQKENVRMRGQKESNKGDPLLTHYLGSTRAHSVSFMPYEDILAIGTHAGIENIVVPGSGMETYRRYENPRVSKKEKRNIEVRRMLDKLPADLISLENEIGTQVKDTFREEIVPMKVETPAGKVKRLMRMHYG